MAPSMQAAFGAPPAAMMGSGAGAARGLSSPAASAAPSARMGQLLLQGWTMLAESCGNCSVPLMREPAARGGRLELCVACERTFVGGVPTTTAAGDDDDVHGGPPPQALPLMADGPATITAADGSSAAAADSNGSARARPTQPQQQLMQPPPQRRLPGAPATGAGSASDRAAEVLSQRMLQGWALLEQCCPICSTPLMRERGTRQIYCVMCNLPVGTPAGPPPPLPAQQAAAAVAPTPAAGSAEAAGCEVAGEQSGGATAAAATAAAGAAAGTQQQQPQQQQQQQAAGDEQEEARLVAAALSQARRALAARVSETSQLLSAAPAASAGGLARTRELAAALAELLGALQLAQQGQAPAPPS